MAALAPALRFLAPPALPFGINFILKDSPKRWWRLCIIRCEHGPQATENKSTRQRSLKHQSKLEALLSYKNKFTKALGAELTEEMETVKERLRNWSKTKLEAEGVALFNLSVHKEGRLFRNMILRLHFSSGDKTLPPHNRFSQGSLVAMSSNHPLDGEKAVEAVVLERTRRFLKVAVRRSLFEGLKLERKWRLDLYANHIAHDRCLSAINIFSSSLIKRHQGICYLEDAKKSSELQVGSLLEGKFTFGEGASVIRELIMRCEELLATSNGPLDSDDIFGSLDELKMARSPPCEISGKNLADVKARTRSYLQSLGSSLNNSQKSAIATAAVQRVTLWQGPPGTGKTKTLSHLIDCLCRRKVKVLACADSNVAVDNLVERLLGLGLNVVRVGQPAKVRLELRECTVDALLAKHPLMIRVRDSKKPSTKEPSTLKKLKNNGKKTDDVKNSRKRRETKEELEARAVKDVLDRADVIVSTCIGAADEVLMNRTFSVCVIDEATQATEPASLVPILRSGAHSIVLVGDPLQLPPTVVSAAALKEGLDVSLFQHLQECGLKPCFLDTQYRMHPEIAALPSKLFYSGRLKTNLLASERPAPCGIPWRQNAKPILFIDCMDSKEESTPVGNSMFNRTEAVQVLKVLEPLKCGNNMKHGWEGIGVLAPYNAQVRLLRDMIFVNGEDDEFKGLEIKTIDGFQGREKEVIIFCTVRSNNKGELGFVSDPRRMNVALTRAKCGLVVIGNSKTLGHNHNWAIWLAYLRKQKLILTVK